MSAPSSTTPRARRLRGALSDPRAPVAVLAGVCLIAFALILHLGRGVGFYYDEWDFVLGRQGHSADVFLNPHNEHISVVPVLVYKVLMQVVGLAHHWPYLLVLAVMHVALATGVFALVRRRVGAWPALGAAVLVLFMGPAWQNILWAFQIGFVGSVLGGVWAFVALDRRDLRGDVLACGLLLFATLSSSLGVPLAVGVAVELLVAGRRRSLWVPAAPLVLYGLWYLGYGVSNITGQGALHAAAWAVGAVAAAAGALFGLGSDWGVVLAVGFLALLAWRTAVAPWTPRLAGVLAAGGAFWALTGAARSVFQPPVPPDSSRYLTLGAIVLLLATVELVAGLAVPRRLIGFGGAIVVLAVLLGLPALRDNALFLRTTTSATDAELGALQLVPGSAPFGYQPDAPHAPQLSAGRYLAVARSLGSSAGDTPAALAQDLSAYRAAADGVLQKLVGRLSPASTARGCRVTRASGRAPAVAVVAVPGGGLVVRAEGKQGVEVKLRRFGDTFTQAPLGTVSPGKPQRLRLPPDASPRPYFAQLASAGGVAACSP